MALAELEWLILVDRGGWHTFGEVGRALWATSGSGQQADDLTRSAAARRRIEGVGGDRILSTANSLLQHFAGPGSERAAPGGLGG